MSVPMVGSHCFLRLGRPFLVMRRVLSLRGFCRGLRPFNSSSSSSSSSSSGDIHASFARAVDALKQLPKDPGNEAKLKLYGLYKQATEGACTTAAPGMFDFVGQSKHQAWKALGQMPKEAAMTEYIGTVTQLGGTAAVAAAAAAAVAPAGPVPPSQQSPVERAAFKRRQAVVADLTWSTIAVTSTSPGVAHVQLNRPAKSNAFDMAMWQDLRDVFAAVDADHRVKVVVLKGNEKAFSSGMDLSVFAELHEKATQEPCEGRRREALAHFIQYLQDAVSAPEVCAVPVIAAVSGHCIGGAVDLLTATDLRYCVDDANFCIKETDLAMVADIGTLQRLPKIVGDQVTRELTYTARTFNGKEAERLGLVLRSFPTYGEMMAHVEATASAIAAKSPLTIRGIKKTILFARDNPNIRASLEHVKMLNAATLLSNDLMSALTSKSPSFKGE